MGATAPFLLALAAQLSDPLGGGTRPGELTTTLVSNVNCRLCHASGSDERMSASSYRGTMMDLAGVDPIFLAALEIAANDSPAAADLCLKCHYPRAWLADRTSPDAAARFGLEDADLEGVQCDYCHRMIVPPPTREESVVPPPALSGVLVGNAQVFLSDELTKHGPLGSPAVAGHDSAYSPLFEDSALCGQCHDVTNTFLPRVGSQGEVLADVVPIERTYSEWRASAYADPSSPEHTMCMGCHMEPYEGRATKSGSSERILHSHRIVGGNTLAPLLVAALHDGNPSSPASLQGITPDAERAVAAAREQLQRAARLLAVDVSERDGTLVLRVRVENLAGHKLPTGYAEGRRMWLAHDVTFEDGTRGPRSGSLDEGTWEFVAGEEPLRRYEIVLAEGTAAEHSFHFASVTRVVSDNRIPPKGFRPTAEIAPVAHDYELQADDTLAHWDVVELPLSTLADRDARAWPARVTVRLYYQPSSGEHLRFLVENAPLYGPPLASALDAVGAAPALMQELHLTVGADGQLDGAPPPPDAGAAPSSDAGSARVPTPAPPACACVTTTRGTPGAPALVLLALVGLNGAQRARARRSGAASRTAECGRPA